MKTKPPRRFRVPIKPFGEFIVAVWDLSPPRVSFGLGRNGSQCFSTATPATIRRMGRQFIRLGERMIEFADRMPKK